VTTAVDGAQDDGPARKQKENRGFVQLQHAAPRCGIIQPSWGGSPPVTPSLPGAAKSKGLGF